MALCHLHGQIAGGGHAAVGLVDEQDALVHPGVHLADVQAHILGAVVDDDDLQILIALPPDALDAAGDVFAGVVDRHDHAYQGLFHKDSSFFTLSPLPPGGIRAAAASSSNNGVKLKA